MTRKLEYRMRALREVRSAIGRLIHRPLDVTGISHEALVRACTAERNRPLEKPRAVLARISYSRAMSRLEHKARQIAEYMEDSNESMDVVRTPADEEIEVRKMLGLHCAAVAGLAPQCRHVYLLRKVHGLSHKDIATQLRITASAVHEHLIRAVQHCDRYLCDKAESGERHVTRWDQKEGRRLSVRGMDSDKRRGFRRTDVDRVFPI